MTFFDVHMLLHNIKKQCNYNIIKANIENNKTTITSNIENISEEEIYINKIKSIITYKENNHEKTIELETYIGTTLNKNETKEIKTIVDKDLKTTTKIEYQIIK